MKPLPTLKLGTISHATLRQQDLIPAYVSALEDLNDTITTNAPDDADSQREHVNASANITALLAKIEQNQLRISALEDLADLDDDSEYWDSEEAGWDLEELEQTLANFTPAYCYFGCTEGDGSDFGVWPCMEQLEEDAEEGEVLKVEDTSAIPADYVGYAMHVNDHGNVTLYSCNKGENREVWAIV